MRVKNYYKILGVERTASSADIKRAYYALVKELHPDRGNKSPELEKRIAEINEAYEVLGDLDKRLDYSILLSYSKKLKEEVKLKDYSVKKSRGAW